MEENDQTIKLPLSQQAKPIADTGPDVAASGHRRGRGRAASSAASRSRSEEEIVTFLRRRDELPTSRRLAEKDEGEVNKLVIIRARTRTLTSSRSTASCAGARRRACAKLATPGRQGLNHGQTDAARLRRQADGHPTADHADAGHVVPATGVLRHDLQGRERSGRPARHVPAQGRRSREAKDPAQIDTSKESSDEPDDGRPT